MKVYPIYHSGFFVELKKHYLLFDYYKGEIPLLDNEKPLYVFVSHNHYDHYNPQIEEVTRYYKNRKFIVNGVHDSKYIYADADKEILVDDVNIMTLDSTDEGVAFLVETENKTIYHAGDLHLWYWDDDTNEERQDMHDKYMAEIEKLKGRNIDVAFLVLDSRQSDDYAMLGLDIFNKLTNTKAIFPMHYSHDEDLMEKRITAMSNNSNVINTRRYKYYEL